jgi:hypothetical protein
MQLKKTQTFATMPLKQDEREISGPILLQSAGKIRDMVSGNEQEASDRRTLLRAAQGALADEF